MDKVSSGIVFFIFLQIFIGVERLISTDGVKKEKSEMVNFGNT